MITSVKALNDLVAALATLPKEIVPARSINTSRPASLADLPHITVSSGLISETTAGIGGVPGSTGTARKKDPKSTRYRADMTFRVDIWAESGPRVEGLSQQVAQFVFEHRLSLRQQGFIKLSISGIGEVVPDSISKASASHIEVWKKRLEYQGIYEQLLSENPGPLGVIGSKSETRKST
jgi:hypothetical protein